MALESTLIEPFIVEASKFRRQPTKGPDEFELRDDDVNYQAEARLPDKLESFLGFMLHFSQRISRPSKVRVQLVAAIRRERKVTDSPGDIERAMYQVTARPHMARPWHNDIAETHVCSGLIER